MNYQSVYIVINKKASIEVDNDILVEDLGDVYCIDPEIKKSIEKIRIKKKAIEEDWDQIKAIDITEKVLTKFSDIDLHMLGEVEILLEYKSQEKYKPFFEFIKVALVCIILFFGASLAIINFHEDVNASKSMEKMYFTFTGKKKENPLVMVIPYSIGIGVGVIMFFNRVFSASKRRKKEPGPMEIQLYSYDQQMEEKVLNDEKNIQNRE